MVEEAKVVVEDAPAAPAPQELPTRASLIADRGFSAAEADSAVKRGLAKSDAPKGETPAKAEGGEEGEVTRAPEGKAPAKEGDQPVTAKGPTSLNFDLTPEEEKKFEEIFGKGSSPRGLYFRMRNERQGRQKLESLLATTQAELKALKEVGIVAKTPEVDPSIEERPLTIKALKELQEAEKVEIDRRQQENIERSHMLNAAQKEQEEFAKTVYPDFEVAVDLAKDLMTNLDALVPEKYKQTRVVKLVRDLQVAASRADEFGLDEYNAAHIAYEIGRMHPKYGQTPAKTGTQGEAPKGDGGPKLTPEQLKRAEDNTRRRGSSAAAPAGGGYREVSADEVTLEQLHSMNYSQRKSFREKFPAQYAQLVRG